MPIRILPPNLVNRIAAGEVIERPASAVKELVENAIDAGATRIEVTLREGGRHLIAVADDGLGMTAEELALAVERHATSKLPDDDLVNIATLGFRGEALPSIGAVGRLTITSRKSGSDAAWRLSVDGGAKSEPEPAALSAGTRVELRDLFYATPARLKFLKATRTELDHAADIVNRLAMAHPEIAFTLFDDTRAVLRYAPSGDLLADAPAARLARLAQVMGRDFADNALPIDTQRESVRLSGYIGLPTLNRATSSHQYLFVNGRPVRDRLLQGALRGAYQDFLARDRHPLVALFVELPADEVDVNVHPAKAEVRFRDPGLVRGLIVGASKHALAEAGHRASTTVSLAALGSFRPGERPAANSWRPPNSAPRGFGEQAAALYQPFDLPSVDPRTTEFTGLHTPSAPPPADGAPAGQFPLGAARAQLHETYIIAQTADGLVIV